MSSIVGLEMPNAWRTGQLNDPNFDISADQLNITTNREMWVPSGTINWDTTLHKNALDPVDTQDLATKNYVDLNSGNQWSTFPASQNVDYVSLYKNINLIEPTNPQDSATKNYVDTKLQAIDLDQLTDVTVTTPSNLEILQYSSGLGQWVNTVLNVPAGSVISQDNSSVAVIDTGSNGRVELKTDNILRVLFENTAATFSTPVNMSAQQITSLGTPALSTDAATKGYVDTEISGLSIPTELDDLDDVTLLSVAVNQVLVNDGLGQWVNQALGKAQLPSTVAYEDETNTFNLVQQLSGGAQFGANVECDMEGGFISHLRDLTATEQGSDPTNPLLTESTMFLDTGTDFNSPDPIWAVLIDRGGVIEKKPVVTSETVFALRNFSNGMFTQETGTKITDAGSPNVFVSIFNENQSGQSFEVVLDGNIFTIEDPDISPSTSNRITLNTGTDLLPTSHFVWIQVTGGIPVMTSSTVEFPAGIDYAVVGRFLFQSYASVLADGAYAVNSPDYEIFDEVSRGHLSHINDKLVEQDSVYLSGIDFTTTPSFGGGTAANVTFTSTSGVSLELHREDIEAFDSTTGIIISDNEGTLTAGQILQLDDIGLDIVGKTCANGTTVIANNDRVNLVLYTIHNDDEPNQTNYGLNFPQDVYATDDDAINDVSNFAVRNIANAARGIALLIQEVVVKITGGGATFEVISITDLRGVSPGSGGGGTGGGSGGATSLDELSDVTIVTPLINQSLIFDGAGQWVNKLTPQLDTPNTWLAYQDFNNISEPVPPGVGVARFFVETIDVNNDGLFIWIQQDGTMRKLRLA